MSTYYRGGAWLFLLGCVMFTVDALSSWPINLYYTTGCMFFNAGCVAFVLDAYKKPIALSSTNVESTTLMVRNGA
jgi:hypothetical protein